ncbi:hypothetical protein KUTeg_017379 [Tegillarca granosa]|uniref:Uncharacterized protein n=1 Tax=Tegillarca granosa TaxID=220873 RepID=A0ABQ9EP89_TEGGR|nr:hypothetical protein KUTeg_017379 [Tegillarca granosa]
MFSKLCLQSMRCLCEKLYSNECIFEMHNIYKMRSCVESSNYFHYYEHVLCPDIARNKPDSYKTTS